MKDQVIEPTGKCAMFRKINEKVAWIAPLLARITIGFIFVESGWGKLHNLDKVAAFFTDLGIPYANLQAPFVASVEFGCGLLVLLGLFTRIASIPLIGTMVVAIITAKRADIAGLSDLFATSEYLYILLLLWLVVAGAGCASVDHFLCGRCCKKKG